MSLRTRVMMQSLSARANEEEEREKEEREEEEFIGSLEFFFLVKSSRASRLH